MARIMRIKLPPEPPEGFCQRLQPDGTWELERSDLPKVWFNIYADETYVTGYTTRDQAERFLPFYRDHPNWQARFPGATWTIREGPFS